MHRIVFRTISLIVLAGLISVPTHAGSFSVNPVRIELSAGRPTAVIQITNLSDEPTTVQAHAVTWRVQQNEDQYRVTDAILLNPPIFTLAPGQKQFIRLGLRRPIERGAEATYRLILDEVPKVLEPGFTGLRTVLRIRIPIFCRPEGPISAQLLWSAEKTDAGLRITAVNRGNAHVQIRGLEVVSESAGSRINKATADYVLPNQSKSWNLDAAGIVAGLIKLKATTDAGEMHEAIAFQIR